MDIDRYEWFITSTYTYISVFAKGVIEATHKAKHIGELHLGMILMEQDMRWDKKNEVGYITGSW